MLSTTKEIEDTADGKETRDMTRAQLTGCGIQSIDVEVSESKSSYDCNNHTYGFNMGMMFPQKVMGGGSGLQYASTIVFLSKRKEKDGTDVIGNIIHCRLNKSRLTKEKLSCRCIIALQRWSKQILWSY